MKLKVKSHVQQARNMRGHKDKFPAPPPDLNRRDGPYEPRVRVRPYEPRARARPYAPRVRVRP